MGKQEVSPKIIRLTRSAIDKRIGRRAANKAVGELKPESTGIQREPRHEARVQAMLVKHNAEIVDP